MAKDHRRLREEPAQGVLLLDDPSFLREVVERMIQELLEAERADHIGTQPPTSAVALARGIAKATG